MIKSGLIIPFSALMVTLFIAGIFFIVNKDDMNKSDYKRFLETTEVITGKVIKVERENHFLEDEYNLLVQTDSKSSRLVKVTE